MPITNDIVTVMCAITAATRETIIGPDGQITDVVIIDAMSTDALTIAATITGLVGIIIGRARPHYRPHRPYYRHAKRHQRGFYTPYRSHVGISFHFGTPGYSRFRWAPSAYSLYRPVYGSYNGYRNRTVCRRIEVEGWHHGHRELVSVKQCSNPWDGTYIVQGSERIISCRW